MDILEDAIIRKYYITDNHVIADKTWEDFSCVVRSKKLILYGITSVTEYFQLRCREKIYIVAVIDNDTEKQKYTLTDFFDIPIDVKISSKTVLDKFNQDEVVILISSMRNYEEIAKELENKGFRNYFSIINLEYNFRVAATKNNLPFETLDDYKHRYAKDCTERYPIQNNKILFFMGMYPDHGRYITKQLLKMEKDLDIVWVVDKNSIQVPKGVRKIYQGKWKQYTYELETSKIWVYNAMPVPLYMIKREEQIYIQTKHWGGMGIKTSGLDDPSVKASPERQQEIKINSNWTDYLICSGDFDENYFRHAFSYRGKALRFGSSRCDIMFHPEQCKDKIYKEFNLSSDEHILIYAPTYRMHKQKKYTFDLQDLNFDMLLDSLTKKWHFIWKIFLRLHPFVRQQSKKIKYPNYVIDVSHYEDVQELMAVSDVMISDFSSIVFDMAHVSKPVFMYSPDKEEYQTGDRKLHYDYNSLPFPISTNNEELAEMIKNFNENDYKQKVKKFFSDYGMHEDGYASERTAKFIVESLSKQAVSKYDFKEHRY